MIGRPSRRR